MSMQDSLFSLCISSKRDAVQAELALDFRQRKLRRKPSRPLKPLEFLPHLANGVINTVMTWIGNNSNLTLKGVVRSCLFMIKLRF